VLGCYVIMPNHCHAILTPTPDGSKHGANDIDAACFPLVLSSRHLLVVERLSAQWPYLLLRHVRSFHWQQLRLAPSLQFLKVRVMICSSAAQLLAHVTSHAVAVTAYKVRCARQGVMAEPSKRTNLDIAKLDAIGVILKANISC
jgi:hypothetical protein